MAHPGETFLDSIKASLRRALGLDRKEPEIREEPEESFEGGLDEAMERLWRGEAPRLSDLASSAATTLERRYGIRLPEGFAAYLRGHAPAEDSWDHQDYIWWAPQRIKSLRKECGTEFPETGPNAEIWSEADKYLVFADYMIWAWAYAICCSEGPNRGRVALIGAEPDRFVADSFTQFVNLAAKDSASLYPP